MLFHEYLFQLRDELNKKTKKWTSKRAEEEIQEARTVQDYNKFVRYCSFSLTSDLFARFTLGRGIAYLRTLDKDPLERMAIVPKLKQQLELISVSQVRSFASKWQLVCLKQWCLTNTIRASSASKSSRRKKSVLVTEIHSESTIPPPELTSEDYQSPKIEFHHSRSKGRGVRCKSDGPILTGETLLVESPIASVIFNSNGAYNCSHCGDALHLPISCPDCSDVLFCSVSCQKSAWRTYHRVECQMRLFGVLHRLAKGQDSVSCGKAIALRLITLKSFGFFLQNKQNFKDPNYSALPGDSATDHAFLWNLYALKYGPPDSNMTTINAFFELLKSTGFAKGMSDEDEQYLFGIMRRYVRIIEANSFAIDEPKPNTRKLLARGIMSCPVLKQQIGSAVYLKSSMINHSCNPNACFVFQKNRIVIAATTKIAPGEEVHISYGFTYPYQGKKSRLLKSLRYDFVCDCVACEENWPGWNSIPTGLVPEEIFDPGRWKLDDILLKNDIVNGEKMLQPQEFLQKLRTLQIREKMAKDSLNFKEFFLVNRDRTELLSLIKQPHFCHHKTRMGVVASLWYKYWFHLG